MAAEVVDLTSVEDSAAGAGRAAVVDLTVDEPPKPGKRSRPPDAPPAPRALAGKALASLDRTEVAEELAKLLACPVCLDAPMTAMSTTLCGHLFCGPCIQKCAETLKQCPTCKAKLKKGSAHRVFL